MNKLPVGYAGGIALNLAGWLGSIGFVIYAFSFLGG